MIKWEIKRAICNKNTFTVLIVGFVIVLLHSIYCYKYLLPFFDAESIYYYFDTAVNVSFIQAWIGGEPFSVYNEVFYYVLFPIFAALPFAASAKSEDNNGYNKIVITKVGRIKYHISKYIAAFLSGGIVVTVISVVSLMIAMSWLPVRPLSPYSHQSGVTNVSIFAYEFYNYPLIYAVVYIIIDFIIAGLFAGIALSLNYIVRNKYMICIIPSLVNMFIVNILDYAPQPINKLLYFIPYVYINPICLLDVKLIHIFVSAIIMFICSFFFFLICGKKRNYLM